MTQSIQLNPCSIRRNKSKYISNVRRIILKGGPGTLKFHEQRPLGGHWDCCGSFRRAAAICVLQELCKELGVAAVWVLLEVGICFQRPHHARRTHPLPLLHSMLIHHLEILK